VPCRRTRLSSGEKSGVEHTDRQRLWPGHIASLVRCSGPQGPRGRRKLRGPIFLGLTSAN
jgi:hypothetical protein